MHMPGRLNLLSWLTVRLSDDATAGTFLDSEVTLTLWPHTCRVCEIHHLPWMQGVH